MIVTVKLPFEIECNVQEQNKMGKAWLFTKVVAREYRTQLLFENGERWEEPIANPFAQFLAPGSD